MLGAWIAVLLAISLVGLAVTLIRLRRQRLHGKRTRPPTGQADRVRRAQERDRRDGRTPVRVDRGGATDDPPEDSHEAV